jgi:hypothetical protein
MGTKGIPDMKRLIVFAAIAFIPATLIAFLYLASLYDPIMGMNISIAEKREWCDRIEQDSPCCSGYRGGLKERAAARGFGYKPGGDNAAWCDVIAHDSPECPKHMAVVELLDKRCYSDIRWCKEHRHNEPSCPYYGK